MCVWFAQTSQMSRARLYLRAMSRRDPARIYSAQRAYVVARLAEQKRIGPERAEAIVLDWEAAAERRGIQRHSEEFWREAEIWIAVRTIRGVTCPDSRPERTRRREIAERPREASAPEHVACALR